MPNFRVYSIASLGLVTNNTVLIQIHNDASFTLSRKYSG
jgi:hypothetical protein